MSSSEKARKISPRKATIAKMPTKKLKISPSKKAAFEKIIWEYYAKNRRGFPWRQTHNPYRILVSEIMLQQTQTDRVRTKYAEWMTAFPTLQSLADAPLKKVLTHWQGLGYNRRALGLYRAATMVAREMGGKIPDTFEGLCALPGVGPYTAGAVMAFAYNKPVPIIETNIRSVFIHFFFNKNTRAQTHNQPATRMSREIQDKDILLLVEATLDVARPREWYYALMDYGAMLKKTIGNPNVHSKHYTRQSQFKGSNRQLRAAIVRAITKKSMNSAVLFQSILADHPHFTKDHIQKNIDTLISEGFLRKKNDTLCVP